MILSTGDVVATSHPRLVNVVREDVVRASRARQCSPWPRRQDGRFAVPRIMERRRESVQQIAHDVQSGATTGAVNSSPPRGGEARNEELNVFCTSTRRCASSGPIVDERIPGNRGPLAAYRSRSRQSLYERNSDDLFVAHLEVRPPITRRYRATPAAGACGG